MSIDRYAELTKGPLAKFLAMSALIEGDVAKQGNLVQIAFRAEMDFLVAASKITKPTDTEMGRMVQPIADAIIAIQELRENLRGSPHFNHLSAVSESIPALGWITITNFPALFVKEMNDSGRFYTNRILKQWNGKDPRHVKWAKSWVQALVDLQEFVKQYHTNGVAWNVKVAQVSSLVSNSPPNCPPPPPFAMHDGSPDGSNVHSALFHSKQAQEISKNLKKLSIDDAHANKSPIFPSFPVKLGGPVPKPPTFMRDGKKWLIEYQKGNKDMTVEDAEMNNVVYLFKCKDSTLSVKSKITSITLDSCTKTTVIFDSLVSCIEFINSQSVQMQVLGKVPTISIDNTDGCQIYLSADSLDVEIISCKSSEMNVLVPAPNGDFTEYPVPEQYKTTVVPGKGLSTIVVDNKG